MVVCFSSLGITGCDEIFKDSGKFINDIIIVENDIEKIKEDF